jgi:hypothetical protein
MLLGFRLLYKTGCYKEWRSGDMIMKRGLGYLSRTEVDYANDILSGRCPRLPIAVSLRYVTAYAPLLAVFAMFLFAGSIPTYRAWQLHEALVKEQALLQKHLPVDLKRYMLTDVRVGFREIARLYKLTVPERDIDFGAVERAVRKLSCNDDNKAKVRDGATYTYEFRDSRQIVRKFEIASCA